ncbi:hypothetical protein [Sphingomonas humi]|uniref:Lipoprotein n=1 Tax=Sphingomonas humi TaxID=335630 RepID=A0ABP7RH18_9SPHN
MKPEFIALLAALVAVFSGCMTVLLAMHAKRKRAEQAASSTTDTAHKD